MPASNPMYNWICDFTSFLSDATFRIFSVRFLSGTSHGPVKKNSKIRKVEDHM